MVICQLPSAAAVPLPTCPIRSLPLLERANSKMALPAGAVPATSTVLPVSEIAPMVGAVVGCNTCTWTARVSTMLRLLASLAVSVKFLSPASPRATSSACVNTTTQSWPVGEGVRLAALLMGVLPLTLRVSAVTRLPADPVITRPCPDSLRVMLSLPETAVKLSVGPPTVKITALEAPLVSVVLLAVASSAVLELRPCSDDRSNDQLPCASAWVVPSLLAATLMLVL